MAAGDRPTRAPRQTTAAALSTSRRKIRSPSSVPNLPRALVSFDRGGGLACRVHWVDGVWGCVAVTHRASLGGASPSCLASRGSARPRACFAAPAGRRSRCTIVSSAAVLKPSARTLGPVPTQTLRGLLCWLLGSSRWDRRQPPRPSSAVKGGPAHGLFHPRRGPPWQVISHRRRSSAPPGLLVPPLHGLVDGAQVRQCPLPRRGGARCCTVVVEDW